jgi:hypothetical protein
MKYNSELLQSIKKDFPKFNFNEENKILSFYSSIDFPEIDYTVLIYEESNGKPYILTSKRDKPDQIVFNYYILNQHLESLTEENKKLKLEIKRLENELKSKAN